MPARRATLKLRVLTYHRVAVPGETPHLDPRLVSASPETFERQARFLGRRRSVVPMSRVLEAVERGTPLPPRAVLVTFDDGYADLVDHAIPTLIRLGLPATIFVSTAFPDHPERSFRGDRLHRAFRATALREVDTPAGKLSLRTVAEREASRRRLLSHLARLPHDRAEGIADAVCGRLGVPPAPVKSVLGWDELREAARHGMEIAAHARSHPRLTGLSDEEISREAGGAREDLERELGSALPVFCYPGGSHDDRVSAVVRESGFRIAFTTLDGANDLATDDPMRLRRTNITPRTTLPVFRLRMTGWGARLDVWRHRSRE